MDKSKLKVYGISVLIAEAVGALAGFITSSGMDRYAMAEKPALTPPDIVFPIVWTVLYALMGISAARIWMTEPSKERTCGLILYVVQLAMNFLWSIAFFNFEAYGFALFWLVAMWFVIVAMMLVFEKLDVVSARLQIPYLIWVAFAGYLNFMVWRLN